ncbi:Translation initiation factor IF-2 [Sporotomaculum syntrophicum]|uniref:Translation initiation factor IF-2 n=1 Tax=Sporotomaculum syntrophicum TaxID=182264 RepID=A0A9D3AYA0_9FIRM|nr:translation initiation factor IF-2 [Sporotomaculum syntrophicum]KAF1084569.1 Translation initiation factor IF-2 [Sporotomaculum syntrophicum]
MVKKRVHELAKELNIESKDMLNQLNKMGITVKSHMSTLEDNEIVRIKNHYQSVGGGNIVAKSAPHKNEKHGGFKTVSNRDRQDRGPGLVDRVPDRPPDRVFTEKTIGSFSNDKGRASEPRFQRQDDKPKNNQYKSSQSRSNQTRGNQTGSSQPKSNQPRPNQPSGQPGRATADRNHAPVGNRTAANKPEQTRGPVSTFRDRNKVGDYNRTTGQQRPSKPFDRSNQGPRTGSGPNTQAGVIAKMVQKSMPDQVKALEKNKAQERSKQVEKHAFKGKDTKDNRLNKDASKERSFKSGSNRRFNKGPQKKSQPAPVVEKKPVVIGDTITVKTLAEKMRINAGEVIKKLMELGTLATINQEIDADTATIVANEMGFEVQVKVELDKEAQLMMKEPEDDAENLRWRPPVVTIMGHVDHGKTSLLDAIRHTHVTASEEGGITQHIGAYQVEHKGRKITFVDTPGHAAFTAMRARGAKVTDIAIVVIAADDGVMPQTVEAINHARAADVPIIVAINKIDKPGADPEKVKRELTEYNLVPEAWGGDTIFVEVSAKEKLNLPELLEMILLVAEVGEFKANPNRAARGTVIEAELDKGRGPVATVLVQNGTLRVGDFIIAGVAYGKVRAMMDYTGRRVSKAGPSTPVEVLGFSGVPPAGELFYTVEDEKFGKQLIDERFTKKREEEFRLSAPKISLDDLFNQIQEGQVKELNIIIKADVQGSVEAVRQSLEQMGNSEVRVNVIHGGVGAITESDIMLASASNAIIIGFNVRPVENARNAVETEKVDIRLYRIIYDAIEDIKKAMSGLLEPEYKEVVLGRAEVRKTFKVTKVGTIAGCYITEGKVTRDAGVRVIRDGIVIHEGHLDSLKRFKDDAKEVMQGYECGITVERFNDIREGDQLEAYIVEAVKRELA